MQEPEADALPLRSYPCALCGSGERRTVMRKNGVRIRRTFDIVACAGCGHAYVNPRVADEALAGLYDEEYYRGEGFDRTIDYAGRASPFKRAEVAAVCASVADAAGGLRGRRWLDVGCGAGFLLEAAAAAGAAAVGFDDSPAALRRCAEKGLPVLTERELAGLAGTFDIVSAVEVIEHVADPRAFLTYLRSFLRPGGVAYVQTGNWNIVRRLPGTPYVMPEGHIHYFTPLEVRRLFREVGFLEARAFNRSWFPWRDLPPGVRRFIPLGAYRALAAAARRAAPGYEPFPIGIRV